MTRKLIFRAKINHSDEWVVGNYLPGHFNRNNWMPDRIAVHGANIHSIAFETLCQLVVDKQGNEVFEGDIIKPTYSHNDGILRVVEWLGESFTMKAIGENLPSYEQGDAQTWIYRFEIVGNIYDNPELLEHE